MLKFKTKYLNIRRAAIFHEEKIRLAGIRTLTSAIPVQRSNQLSYQANWELVIKLVRNIPGKDEDEIMNI